VASSENSTEGHSPFPRGHRLRLSLPRRWVGDLLHFARQAPSLPVQRHMTIGEVVDAQRRAEPRPSWVAVFAKAYGIVARDIAPLRRALLQIPWDHLYEHPESVASVAIGRDFDGEEAVFFGHLRAPENQTIAAIDERLRHYKEAPLEEFHAYRMLLRISRLWRPLRRLAWWFGLNHSGRSRAKRFGTFGVSVYSGLGVESLHPLSPLTTLLNYGPIGPDGGVNVRIVYDHRVLDGATVGRALIRLEEVLRDEIAAELRSMGGESAPIRRSA
jgi:hypothetical protein